MAERIYNVLFLSTNNCARSIIAEAILKRLGRANFYAFSAGLRPGDTPHPYALDLLHNLNYTTDFAQPKHWHDFIQPDVPDMDFIFSLSDELNDLDQSLWPGQPMMANWSIPDPKMVEGTEAEKRYAFAEAYRMMDSRISIFVNLPLHSIDKLSLQQKIQSMNDNMKSQTYKRMSAP